MGFFNWSPEEGQTVVSPWVWLYFAITAGFSCITMSIWYLYNRMKVNSTKHREGEADLEMLSLRTEASAAAGQQSRKAVSVFSPDSPRP